MALLVAIPARSGSKGLRGKNLRAVGGISLVGRAAIVGRLFANHGLESEAIVLVDTDSEEIAAEGRRWGAQVPFLRPARLALDGTSTLDTITHTVGWVRANLMEVDQLLLLQPTSPLRTRKDVVDCWRIFHPEKAPSVVSIVEIPHGNLGLTLGTDERAHWLLPAGSESHQRQGATRVYRPNGAVYVQTMEFLERERSFLVAGKSRGCPMAAHRSVDVDALEDLELAEVLGRADDPPAPRILIEWRAGDPIPWDALPPQIGLVVDDLAEESPVNELVSDASGRGHTVYARLRARRTLPPGLKRGLTGVVVVAEELATDRAWWTSLCKTGLTVLIEVDNSDPARLVDLLAAGSRPKDLVLCAERVPAAPPLRSLARLGGFAAGAVAGSPLELGVALTSGLDLVLVRGLPAPVVGTVFDTLRRLRPATGPSVQD